MSTDPPPTTDLVDKGKDKTGEGDTEAVAGGPSMLSASSVGTERSGGDGTLEKGGTPPESSQSQGQGQPMKKTPQDFIFGRMIGDGSFSSVYLAKDVKTSKEFAIKVCDKHHIIRERKAESIKREKEVLSILSGNTDPTAPFFVHLYATFQDTHRLYFVMTLAHGGELLKYLNKLGCFDKKLCQFYSGEIIQALKHLHKLGIVHRDLKPENILLDDCGHILVTDFGSAKLLTVPPCAAPARVGPVKSEVGSRTRSNSFVGTAQYVSPEVLQGKYTEVGPPADLWGLGCIIYQFLSSRPPFQAPNEFLIFRKILNLEFAYSETFDEDAKDLISKLLKVEPTERLGALDQKLYTSIENHAYFAGIDFETLHEMEAPMISAESANLLKTTHPGIPSSYEPGFDPRTIAERFLRSDEDSPWEDTRVSSDESEESTNCQSGDPQSNKDDTETSKTAELLDSLNIESQNGHTEERLTRIQEQARSNPWHKSVKENLILKQGLVSKRKGLFSRRRELLLTEGPHLYYCDPSSKSVKGEIPWSSSLKAEPKDFKIFYIHTPNRIYYLEDPKGYALAWCDAINAMLHETYQGKEQEKKS